MIREENRDLENKIMTLKTWIDERVGDFNR
jgi:hypothetical protein